MAEVAMRSDARRNVERVLESASAVLSRNPSASVEQVAAASGVHRSTVYRRFPTREVLVQALLERALGEVSALIRRASVGQPDEGKLAQMCDGMVLLGERYAFLLMHYRIADLGPDPVGLNKLMRRYQRAGVVRGDVSAAWLASVFIAVGTALFDGSELDQHAPELFLKTFLEGARPSPRTA
jgi:AcrR family transcriptional regulator